MLVSAYNPESFPAPIPVPAILSSDYPPRLNTPKPTQKGAVRVGISSPSLAACSRPFAESGRFVASSER